MKKKNDYSLYLLLVFIFILQVILKYMYRIPYFSIESYIKNVFFAFVFIISFGLKQYEWLLTIPIIYGLQYIYIIS